MGLGASLAFIAIGAILAFAIRVDLSGIDIHMVGWILILVGVVGLALTLMYTRPRARAVLDNDVVEEEPLYVVHEEPAPHVHEPAEEHSAVPPHVHTDQTTVPAQPAPPAQPAQPGQPGQPAQQAPVTRPAEQAPQPGQPGHAVHQPGQHLQEGRRAPHERL